MFDRTKIIGGICKILICLSLGSGVYAQPQTEDQLVLPHLSAGSSTSASGFARQISANEILRVIDTDAGLVVVLTSYTNGVWQAREIASLLCDCYSGYPAIGKDYAVVEVSYRDETESRLLLVGRDSEGQWRQELIPSGGFPGPIYPLQDGVLMRVFTEDGSDSLLLLALDSRGAWSVYGESHLPGLQDEKGDPVDILGEYDSAVAGRTDNLIVLDKPTGTLSSFERAGSGQWTQSTIAPVKYSEIYDIEYSDETVMLYATNQDYELPNQGAVDLFKKTEGQWQREATIYSRARVNSYDLSFTYNDISRSSSLLNESAALIENVIYERQPDGQWNPTAGINTGVTTTSAFIENGILGWISDSENFNVANWSSSPVCENEDANGVGVFLGIPCAIRSLKQATSPPDGVLTRSQLDRTGLPALAPELNTNVASAVLIDQYLSDTQFEQRLVHYRARDGATDDGVIEKVEIPLCSQLARTDCYFSDVIHDDSSAMVALNNTGGRAELYALEESSSGDWNHQKIDIVDAEYMTPAAVSGDIAAVLISTASEEQLKVLQRNGGQWEIVSSVSLSALKIRSWALNNQVSISGNRLAISDYYKSKIHLFVLQEDGDLWYEETVEPDDTGFTYYRANGLQDNTLIVGGAFSGNYTDEEFDTYFGNYHVGWLVDPGVVRVYNRDAGGDWIESQTLQGDKQTEHSFGQQVFIQGETAIVMALRPFEINPSQPYFFEPNYLVYRRDGSGNFQFVKKIEHVSGSPGNCLDCEFPVDVNWDVKITGRYLFAPLSDSQARMFVVYDLFDDSTSPINAGITPADQENDGNECVDPDGDGWGWDGATSCRVAAQTDPAEVTSSCDYSSADLNNGWGWDPVTAESCFPEDTSSDISPASDCDYSNASAQGGWGWNPVRLESCAPLTDEGPDLVDDSACDYAEAARNDGWGWNPVTMSSCPPL